MFQELAGAVVRGLTTALLGRGLGNNITSVNVHTGISLGAVHSKI